ncbi:hypothetical protein [Halorussus litoreus]|uniref:hypothetical protein n=1 Tax=Halorussus litoreus TaxID=1710536 RepID=UPI001300B066|nr:hypothetical protein [Halorussus litoreus]
MAEMHIDDIELEVIEIEWTCKCGHSNANGLSGGFTEKVACQECRTEYELIPENDTHIEVHPW